MLPARSLVAFALVMAFCLIWIFTSNGPGPSEQENESRNHKLAETETPDDWGLALYEIKTGPNGETYRPGYLIRERDLAFKRKTKASRALPWVERGPGNVSGRVRAIVVDKSDASGLTWVAASIGGGLWRTTDAGQSWSSMGSELLSLSTPCLAQSASNPDVWYVGTGMGYGRVVDLTGAGIWKSVDHGQTWTQLTSTANGQILDAVNRLVIDPNNPDIVLSATSAAFSHLGPKDGVKRSGIFRTADGGITWTEVFNASQFFGPQTDNRVQQILADPSNFNKLYAAINEVGVVRSLDGGLTWSVSANNFALASDINNPVGGGAGYNPRSVRTELAISPSDPNRLYAAVERPRGVADLYMSKNAGASWVLVNDTGNDPNWFNSQGLSGATGAYCAGWFDNTLAVDPTNPDIVWVGGVHLYRITITGNASRTTQLTGRLASNPNTLVHADHHWLQMLPQGNGLWILDGNDGGLGISKDGGSTWTQNTGMRSSQFYGIDKMPGGLRFIGGTQDNGTWVSGAEPGLESVWSHVIGGDGFEAVWHATNPDWLLGGSQYNGLSRTLDGGQTWQPLNLPNFGNGPFITKIAQSKADPDRLFILGSNGIARSEDFGSSWHLVPISQHWLGYRPYDNVEMSLADPQIVWATSRIKPDPANGLVGGVHVSTDGGLSYLDRTASLPPGLVESSGLASHPTDPNTAYLLFAAPGLPKVLKTNDLGQTWQDLSQFVGGLSNNGFPDVAVFSLLVLPHQPDTLWAGTEIGLFVSENAGQTWEIADNGLPPVAIFQISAVEDQILLATQGRGLWTLQVPELLNLPKPAYVLSPRLLDVGMHANGSWHAVVEMRDLYTETLLLVNGEPFQTWPANFAPGRVDVWGPVTAPQNLTLQVQSTLDQKVLASAPQSVSVFSNASQGDGTLSFEASQTNQDWQTSGLNFGTLSGFSGRGLQSPHPYSAGQNLIAQLKRPVVVAEEETRFSYRDVALLEPGDSGSVFGSGSFYDFVVVEASEDGVTWLPVVDGYDATFDPAWLSLYQSSGSPNSSHLRSHSFNLNDFFAVGHQVFVRWRLYADPGVNGWGWWISDIALQRNGQAQMVQSELLFPWMSHSSDFDSLLVLVNPQDSEMQVQLKGRRSQGPSFTQTISLPAWGSAAQPLDSLFPNLEQGSGLTVTASSASPNLKGSWVTYQTERGSGLSPAFGEAVSVLVDRPDRERMGRTLLAGFFPAFSDQVAACVIAQPALRQGGIQAEMRDSLGTALPLPSPFSSPNAYRPNAALVDPATQAEVQWLLSGADPFCGVGFVFNSFNEPAIGMLQPLDRLMFDSDSSEFVLPWVSQNQRFQSQVIINNVGREPASVHLIARRGDGTTAETDRTVPSMGFLSESAANLFPTLDDGPGFCVQVMGDKPGLVGRWVTFQLEAPSGHSPSQGTSIDRKIRAVDTSAGSHLLFTFLPVANGFISAPVLVNLANEPADISLSFRNQQGQIVFTDSVAGLMPMTPFARALPNWVPQDQGDLILEVQATQRICGVGFVFNASAEPAIGLAQALAP